MGREHVQMCRTPITHDEGVQIAEPGLGAHGLGPGQQQHLAQVPPRLEQVGEKTKN